MKQNRKRELTGAIPKHHQILESQDAAIHIIDTDMRIVFFNSYFQTWCDQLEIDLPKNPLGESLFSAFSFLALKIRREYDQVFRTGEKLTTEEKVKIRDKTYFVRTEKIPLIKQDEVEEVITIITNLTERKKSEERERRYAHNMKFLSDSAMRFVEHPLEEDIFPLIGEQLATLIPNSIVIVTAYHNESKEAEVKVVAGVGNRIKEVHKILGRKAQGMRTVLDTESARKRLYRGKLVRVEGGLHEISFQKLPLSICRILEKAFGVKALYSIGFTHKGALFGAAAIILRNESELKNRTVIEAFINQTAVALQRWKAEKKIVTSLKEKEVLLREIHHRVKNNMQIISSLLRLQSRGYEDESVRSLFQSSQDRIKSMALIHESLYRSSDLAQIDFHKYVTSLATHLRYMYKEETENISLDIDVANIYLDINQSIPLGLILNELISNAMKHAFPHNSRGTIQVVMRTGQEKTYQLTVGDNGVGLPGELDFQNSDTLGMQLVTDLTRQIHGTIRMEKDPGTRFTIIFPQGS